MCLACPFSTARKIPSEDHLFVPQICDLRDLAASLVEKCAVDAGAALYNGEDGQPWNVAPVFSVRHPPSRKTRRKQTYIVLLTVVLRSIAYREQSYFLPPPPPAPAPLLCVSVFLSLFLCQNFPVFLAYLCVCFRGCWRCWLYCTTAVYTWLPSANMAKARYKHE